MTLAEDLDGHQAELQLDEILDLLELAERDALVRALQDRKGQRADGHPLYRWSETELSKRLKEEGWRVSPQKIRRWRQVNVTS